jgi:hypothetical protein
VSRRLDRRGDAAGLALPEIDLRRNASGVEVAVYGNDQAPVERHGHGDDIDRVETYVGGRIAYAQRSVDTLGTLYRNGSISGPMLHAGRRFMGIWRTAHFSDVHAASMVWTPDGGEMSNEQAERVTAARRQMHGIVTILGGHRSPSARSVWFVLGVGLSVSDWALRERMGRGRPLNRKTAGGILIGSLGCLSGTLGTGREGAENRHVASGP